MIRTPSASIQRRSLSALLMDSFCPSYTSVQPAGSGTASTAFCASRLTSVTFLPSSSAAVIVMQRRWSMREIEASVVVSVTVAMSLSCTVSTD